MNKALANWKLIGEGIYVPKLEDETGIVCIGSQDINELKTVAANSVRKRARLCAHTSNADQLHQMILVIQKESYIHPHRHHGKIESFHLIEGDMDVVIFADDGKIDSVIPMSAEREGKGFLFYRLSKDRYHTLIIHTPYVVFQEITQGPFDLSKTDNAPWAPRDTDVPASQAWIEKIKKEIRHA